jgi:hypothetical protein
VVKQPVSAVPPGVERRWNGRGVSGGVALTIKIIKEIMILIVSRTGTCGQEVPCRPVAAAHVAYLDRSGTLRCGGQAVSRCFAEARTTRSERAAHALEPVGE